MDQEELTPAQQLKAEVQEMFDVLKREAGGVHLRSLVRGTRSASGEVRPRTADHQTHILD